MAVTEARKLPIPAYVKNLMPVYFTSTGYIPTPGTAPTLQISRSSSPINGDVLALTINFITYSFTCVTTVDSTGLTIPSQGALTNQQYMESLATALKKNYTLFLRYKIEALFITGQWRVLLTGREPGATYNFTASTFTASRLTFVNANGVNAVSLPNYRVLVQLWRRNDDGTDTFLGLEDLLAIDAAGKSRTNINDYLDSLIVSSFTYPELALSKRQTSMSVAFFYRFCEYFGASAAPQAMTDSEVFYALPGKIKDPVFNEFYLDLSDAAWTTSRLSVNLKEYLTNYPFPKKTFIWAKEKLYLVTYLTSVTWAKLLATIYYSDLTILTIKATSFYCARFQVFELALSYNQAVQQFNPTKTIEKIDVQVLQYNNLYNNSEFPSPTGWATGAGWVITGGRAVATATTANLENTTFSLVSGTSYTLEFTLVYTSGSFDIKVTGAATILQPVYNASGSYSLTFTPSATGTLYFDGITAFTGEISEVVLYPTSGGKLSGQIMTYEYSPDPVKTPAQFLFKNELGGYDTLITSGNQKIETDNVIEQYISSSGSMDPQVRIKKGALLMSDELVIGRNTGPLTKAQRSWITEFLASEEIYEIYQDHLMPVVLESGKTLIEETDEYPYSISFSYRRKMVDFVGTKKIIVSEAFTVSPPSWIFGAQITHQSLYGGAMRFKSVSAATNNLSYSLSPLTDGYLYEVEVELPLVQLGVEVYIVLCGVSSDAITVAGTHFRGFIAEPAANPDITIHFVDTTGITGKEAFISNFIVRQCYPY